MKRLVLSLLLTAGAFSALSSGTASASHAATGARLLTCAGRAVAKPSRYIISCADANAAWKLAHWTAWGGRVAAGKGEFSQNDCTPYCAAGHFHTYRAAFHLSGVVPTLHHGNLYSELKVGYRVGSKWRVEHFGLYTSAPAGSS